MSSGTRGRLRAEASMDELAQLARSAGASVVGTVIQDKPRLDPATLIGRGKVEEITRIAEEKSVDVLFFDHELSPMQQRNLEAATDRKVLDRTQLILDIFARRARTREGRLQVELAQLDYLLPRLAGKGIMLSRLGGGIGTRGPGETKLETDKRRIRQRIQAIKREIERVRRTRETRQSARIRAEAPVIALVGYTNAGKSTLFSAMTLTETAASDQLFLTLDPLVRRARLGRGQDVLMVDTVGFIQKLPHQLVAAFRATLEEVSDADLLLHVMDASADDLAEREGAVNDVLKEIGAAARPRIDVLNKVDQLGPERRSALQAARPEAVLLSARSREGLAGLKEVLSRRLDLTPRMVTLRFGAGEARAIAALYTAGRVLTHEVEGDDVRIEAEIPLRLVERYKERML